jgi:asparagine synthase (glutamine-hydrolysing)
MCGIAGFVGTGERESLERMLAAVQHRGPNDQGIVLERGVGLAHARLSVIDTSAAGHQPMFSPDRSVAIVFNGEIYNWRALRKSCEERGAVFASSSDTEVLLALYVLHGEKFLRDVIGMFAIALYDFKERKLILARDVAGEKPLYWTRAGDALLFASELGGLMASGRVPKELNLAAVNQYLLFDYVPTPESIFKNVHKLEPGTMLVYRNGAVRKETFWSPPKTAYSLPEKDALATLDRLFAESVSRQLVADVPLGVFLSGGIDSSTVAAYAARASAQKIDTFSIGFEEVSFDESRYAREVAQHLGTRHHEEIVSSKDALALIPNLADALSEPMADASIIPTLLLSRFARKSVTVALGGDGADELFAGYPTFHAERLFSLYQHLPDPLARLIARGTARLPASHSNFSLSYNLKKFTSSSEKSPLHRHQEWLGSFGENARAALAGPALREYTQNEDLFSSIDAYKGEMPENDAGNQLLYSYLRTYLMDEVLVKVDRASMHYALETRAPFLDRMLLDFVFSLPYDLKYRGGQTKYLLKRLTREILPSHIINRKKKGFGVPLAEWLSGPLRPLSEELLSGGALAAHGLFNEREVTRLLHEHWNGTRDNRKELWNLMVFQLWYQRWMR